MSIHEGTVVTGIQKHLSGVCEQAERITHEFLTALRLGKQEGFLGQKCYLWDHVNVVGTKPRESRLFTVGNLCLAYRFP